MNELKCIFPKNATSHLPAFTWDSRWIWEYESPWGVFEKFKLANETNDIGIFEIFGTEQVKSRSKGFYSNEERALNILKVFNEDRFLKILGLKLKETSLQNINKLIGVFPNSNKLSFYIEKDLHFCPECIKLGYDSIFHQFKLFDKCPFHGNSIESKCPKCQNVIPYLLTDKWARSPFTCKCGHQFYQTNLFDKFIRDWSSPYKLEIKSLELVKWLSLQSLVRSNLKNFILNENIKKFYLKNLIKFSLSIIDKSFIDNDNFIYHEINSQKNKQLIKTKKQYTLKIEMQNIIDRFKIENYELIGSLLEG